MILKFRSLYLVGRCVMLAQAFDTLLGFQGASDEVVEVETRSIDEIYSAAVAEGGIVTLWHGGDEKNQNDNLKAAFESKFPQVTLNLTTDLSKYLDVEIDRQLALGSSFVDSVMLQTLQDFPRWDLEGALLHYKPANFNQIYDSLRDTNGAYYGVAIAAMANVWNSNKLESLGNIEPPKTPMDYLKPDFKDKLVFTYPNDDDGVLFQFFLIIDQYGASWFDQLLLQNPRWVRGVQTPATLIESNSTCVASFSTGVGTQAVAPFGTEFPAESRFVSWAQHGAIFKNAPHPESAKLLHNYILTPEGQAVVGSWSVRKDVEPPSGYPSIMDMPQTDPTKFTTFMSNREEVEKLRFWFETKLGPPQGESPLVDNI